MSPASQYVSLTHGRAESFARPGQPSSEVSLHRLDEAPASENNKSMADEFMLPLSVSRQSLAAGRVTLSRGIACGKV